MSSFLHGLLDGPVEVFQDFGSGSGHVLISDEYHDACYVYGFRVNEDVLYALLDYDDGRLRTVPVSDLCVVVFVAD